MRRLAGGDQMAQPCNAARPQFYPDWTFRRPILTFHHSARINRWDCGYPRPGVFNGYWHYFVKKLFEELRHISSPAFLARLGRIHNPHFRLKCNTKHAVAKAPVSQEGTSRHQRS
jgi:hypothetical protein